jgi:hypothetical protein
MSVRQREIQNAPQAKVHAHQPAQVLASAIQGAVVAAANHKGIQMKVPTNLKIHL